MPKIKIDDIIISEETIKAIITDDDGANRPYIIAIISHFCRYATREWNTTEIEDSVIKGYMLTMCKD